VQRRIIVPTGICRFFLLGGSVLVLAGMVGLGAALTQADTIRQRLPEVAVDAAAVGGAAAALALAALLLGLGHLLVAIAMGRGAAWSLTAGIVLGHIVGGLLLALAAAAWVVLADGGGMLALAGGIGLVLASLGYGVVVVLLIGQKRRSEGSGWL